MKKNSKITEDRAKLLVDGFQMTEIYHILTEYFSKDEAFVKRGYDLNKGLLVVGPVGTGKTEAFNVFQEIFRCSNQFFLIVATRHIIRDYTNDGAKILNKYGKKSFDTIYFDDLGLEEVNTKMFGNNANVMSEILMDRYENFKRKGVLTFASSNLSAKQFEEIYGERMRDRMREMFNIIQVTGKSFRK